MGGHVLGKWTLCGVVLASLALARPSMAQRALGSELQERAALEYHERRVRSFIEDTFRFYEISGEMVSYRVEEDLTESDVERIKELSEDLDDQARRLTSFITYLTPRVRGHTDGLWVITPLGENASLEDRLTLILSLVNSVESKIDQLTALLTGEADLAVEVDELALEAALPYFIAGGLEELRTMTRELRESL